MQPVKVRPGAQPVRQYVDGGVREPTPLQAAIDNGAETIIAITLGPRQHPADATDFTKAVPILERTLELFSEDGKQTWILNPALNVFNVNGPLSGVAEYAEWKESQTFP